MRTTLTVAGKDFSDASRSLSLWVATALLVLVACAVFAFFWGAQDIAGPRLEGGIEAMTVPIQFLVGLIALLVGFGSVVGERTTGSMKILLGLPPTRRDVFLGKFVGRFLVTGVAVVVAFLAVALLGLGTFGEVPVATFLALVVATLLLAAVWTSLAVSISAVSESRTRVIAACLTVWVVFTLLWDVLLLLVYYVVEGKLGNPSTDLAAEPEWLLIVERLNPVDSFAFVATEFSGQVILPAVFNFVVRGQRWTHTTAERLHGREGATEVPFYLANEFGVVVLLAWIVVPLVVGYRRFQSTDI